MGVVWDSRVCGAQVASSPSLWGPMWFDAKEEEAKLAKALEECRSSGEKAAVIADWLPRFTAEQRVAVADASGKLRPMCNQVLSGDSLKLARLLLEPLPICGQ